MLDFPFGSKKSKKRKGQTGGKKDPYAYGFRSVSGNQEAYDLIKRISKKTDIPDYEVVLKGAKLLARQLHIR